MADLKELLGENYKDNMTPEEIVGAIKENDKIVSLTTGNYVSKGKFEDLSAKYSKTMEETKDYDTFKQRAEEYESYKKNVGRKETFRKAGVKDEFLDYALFQVEKGKIPEDDKFDEHVNEWISKNPIYVKPKQEGGDEKKPPEPKDKNPKKPKILVGGMPKDDKGLPKKPWNRVNHSFNI